MASPYRGPFDVDAGLGPGCVAHHMGLIQKKPQHVFRVSGNDWKTAPPVMRPFHPLPASSSQCRDPNTTFGERHNFVDPQQRIILCGSKQAPSLEFNSFPARSYNLFTSESNHFMMPTLDSAHVAPYEGQSELLSSKPFAQYMVADVTPEAPLNGLQGSVLIVDDAECERAPSVLAAIVNQVLDDTDDDFKRVGSACQSLSASHKWCMDNESIGELAIKLADLALMDDYSAAKPPNQMNYHNEANSSSLNPVLGTLPNEEKRPKCKLGNSEAPNLEQSKKESGLNASYNAKLSGPNFGSEGSRFTRKKSGANSGYQKKKKSTLKFTQWAGPPNKFNPIPFKNTWKGLPNQSYDAKQVYVQPTPSFKKPFFVPSVQKMKSTSSPKHQKGVTNLWMQLPGSGSTGSKSDGSSSSNSSVHKESIHRPSSDLLKYKVFSKANESEEDSSPSAQQPRRSRKAHSSSSSSSGGRGKYTECVFCKTNGETSAQYRSHVLKDERGRTMCKVLQKYECPLCGATGFNAHTVKYCPKNDNPPPIATMTTLKSMRSSTGRKRPGPCSGQVRGVPFNFNHNLLPA